ncbi:MAG: T9SS type A sorting domain-containing protein, partial [Flavobacteriales bacterium]|nr:T9SS type A sorting domain-containing protein [Flavobacteriales bacterium]
FTSRATQKITDADDDGVSDDSERIEIQIKTDTDGNTVYKKYVNGEEVEFDPKTDRIDMDIDFKHLGELEGLTHKVEGLTRTLEIKLDGLENMGNDTNQTIRKFEFHTDFDGENMSDEEREIFEKKMEKFKLEMEDFKFDMENMDVVILKAKGIFENDSASDLIHNRLDNQLHELQIKLDLMELDDLDGLEGLNHRVIVIHDESDEVSDNVHIRKEMRFVHHSTGEDFTIVLVTENLDAKKATKIETSKKNELDVNIFPNPAKEKFTLNINATHNAKTSVTILDVNGKVVYNENLGKISESYSQDIDISKLETGMYFVKVKQGKSVSTKKLMIQ